jgi:5-methylcytosine-specific restriction endonuclease McrA
LAGHIPYEENHRITEEGELQKKCIIHNIYSPEDKSSWFSCTEEYFYKNKMNSIDGLHPWCKQCSSKKAQQNQDNNPERYMWYRLKYQKTEKGNKVLHSELKILRNKGWFDEYYADHPDQFKMYRETRKAKEHDISNKEWRSCQDYFKNEQGERCCAYCGLPISQHYIQYRKKIILGNFHKEHVINNGANNLSNCVPSCRDCNDLKHKSDLNDWYKEGNPVYDPNKLNKILKWINEDWKKFYAGGIRKKKNT